MSKCNKVKNPCKICLGPVSNKSGLQCHGACASWVHFSCLNYTPGKIKDIKAGIIKVTCPCPDCKTTMPKEYRTDQPYSCNNSQCPANRPPKCENNKCPINERSKPSCPPQPPPCPLNKCGNECKQFSSPQLPNAPPAPPLGPPCSQPRGRGGGPEGGYGGGGNFGGGYGGGGGGYGAGGMSSVSSSDACLSDNKCPSGCSSTNDDIPGDFGVNNMSGSVPSFHVVEQMCNTVGQLTNQINDLMSKMKQACKEKEKDKGGCPPPNPGCGPPPNPGNGCGPPPKINTGPEQKECKINQKPKPCPKPCCCPGNKNG